MVYCVFIKDVISVARDQDLVDNGVFSNRDLSYVIIQGNTKTSLLNTGFMGLVSHCYSNHLPLAIAPHDIWILILSEITKEIAKNPQQYRGFFTDSDKKEEIIVPSDSTVEIPIDVLSNAVANKVLFDASVISQNFSTENLIVTKTIQAIFCDMASPFYSYDMFMCGIPSIEILGTVEDWEKLSKGLKDIVSIFNTARLNKYFSDILPIIKKFIDASNGDIEKNYWKDIFTQENVGSGGDLIIDGWLKNLFLTKHILNKINNFTSSYGVVKYKQVQTNEEFVAIYGGFHETINGNGFHQLEYSQFIMQKNKLIVNA